MPTQNPVTTIKCHLCGHIFITTYKVHCKCQGCGKSISVIDAARFLAASASGAAAWNPRGAPTAATGPAPAPPTHPADAGLGPALRDKDGKPLPKPADPRPAEERPRYASEDFSFIARRTKQLRQEREERVARGESEEMW